MLDNTTLIIPTVAIGNVPQLATDLLIHTYLFQKVRVLSGRYLYPFASPRDTTGAAADGVSYSLELYYCKTLNVATIQQRSPVLSGHLGNFVKEVILPLIESEKFARVVILDSSDAGLLMRDTPWDEYFGARAPEDAQTPSTFELYETEINLSLTARLGGLKLHSDELSLEEEKLQHSSLYTRFVMRGLRELSALGTDASHVLKVTALLTYVYEGDNFRDAEALASKVVDVLQLESAQWLKPVSWEGVYGQRTIPDSMEEGIFG
ncbi:hypothetical protein BABINDRAFT_160072 [Babjeviella inositovora NRRL Y-12698]|uniref:Proteasome assembly chaperone 2 n=1 Tax=Babjeviella inositovora NRRL Y-12698 TaxID=984486 RepID=A0A1E3QW46_9ASCO|nr:uncharacterized protein BABINDRAFT_160072 [Babjeviella inositovora NRRL Y-12698]ODQ81841.1 hypothetical protein BABINDRAFT_160072 [Babjeviella inositovora NRRL Y-12698]